MHPLVRVVIGVIAGILASFVIVACAEFINVIMFIPKGTDMTNPEVMKSVIRNLPPTALILVLAGWGIGAFLGTFLAAKIARGWMHGFIVGVLLFTSAVMNMLSMPHPTWFWGATFVVYFVTVWLGTRLGAPPRASAVPPAQATAVLTAIGLVVTSGWAAAGEAPGDWWRERMNQDFSVRPIARVTGPFGKIELAQPRAEDGGLRAETIRSLRGGAVQAGFAENDPKLLAWDSIDRVEVPTTATGFGALMGAFAGTAAALVAAVVADDPTTHSAVRPAAMIAGGACLGAAFGAGQQRWHAYYPPPDRGLRVHPVPEKR